VKNISLQLVGGSFIRLGPGGVLYIRTDSSCRVGGETKCQNDSQTLRGAKGFDE